MELAKQKKGTRYRGFLIGVVACYVMEIVLGLLAGHGLVGDTAFFILNAFNAMLAAFVIAKTIGAMAGVEKALARARTAEKSRSMFFSIVSHDIRTPLNAILGYSELLQNGITDKAERDEALDSIRASGTTLLQLVNDVLDLAKMDAGKMTLSPEPVSLSRLTGDVFASFRLAAADKGIALVNMTADMPTVLLDAHRFRQILFNLVGNAVKFTERGSVTVSASYDDESLEVVVSDTGCGIPSDMLSHVLDPFVQVQDRSHSADRIAGTGLGLVDLQKPSQGHGRQHLGQERGREGNYVQNCDPRRETGGRECEGRSRRCGRWTQVNPGPCADRR